MKTKMDSHLFVISLLLWFQIAMSTDANEILGMINSSSFTVDSKLMVKHHIAYHFKQTVNEVSQELFVSRQLDIEPLVLNLRRLRILANQVYDYCNSADKYSGEALTMVSANSPDELVYDPDTPTFVYIPEVDVVTREEARAKCESYGMRLPEVYTRVERLTLMNFMIQKGINFCHAGIVMDLVVGYHRFISTGLPIWQGDHWFANATHLPNESRFLDDLVDKPNYNFFYYADGNMYSMEMDTRPIYYGVANVGSYYSRKNVNGTYQNKYINDIVAKVICAPRYRGPKYDFLYRNRERSPNLQHLNTKSVEPRLHWDVEFVLATPSPHNVLQDWLKKEPFHKLTPESGTAEIAGGPVDVKELFPELDKERSDPLIKWDDSLLAYCKQTAFRLDEAAEEGYLRVISTLAAVDISVEGVSVGSLPDERIAQPWVKAIFSLGNSPNIPVEKILRSFPEIGISTKVIQAVELLKQTPGFDQGETKGRSENLDLLISFMKRHSISLSRLSVTPNSIDSRISTLARQLDQLQRFKPQSRAVVLTALTNVNGMMDHVLQTLDNSHRVLADITYKAIMHTASLHALPTEAWSDIQSALSKRRIPVSVNKDYALTRSYLLTDPEDATKLLIIMEAAATAHDNLELIRLMPVPYFTQDKAYFPILESEYVVLNQHAGLYQTITPLEAEACLAGKCYINSMPKPVISANCGIPQLYDQYLSACDYRSSPSTGMFIETAAPDGIVYSLFGSYIGQVHCSESTLVGEPLTMTGVGTMYVPTGCVLSVSDGTKNLMRIKGTPTYQLMEGMIDLKLAANSLSRNEAETPTTDDHVDEDLWGPIERQILEIRKEVERNRRDLVRVDARFWSGLAGLIVLISLVLACLQVLWRHDIHNSRDMKIIAEQVSQTDRLRDEVGQMKATIRFMKETVALDKLSLDNKSPRKVFKSTARPMLKTRFDLSETSFSQLGRGYTKRSLEVTPPVSPVSTSSNPFTTVIVEPIRELESEVYVQMNSLPVTRLVVNNAESSIKNDKQTF